MPVNHQTLNPSLCTSQVLLVAQVCAHSYSPGRGYHVLLGPSINSVANALFIVDDVLLEAVEQDFDTPEETADPDHCHTRVLGLGFGIWG